MPCGRSGPAQPAGPGVTRTAACRQLLHGRPEPERFHVRGYVEEDSTTTPYDLLARNGVSRHGLVIAALGHLHGRATVTGDLAAAHARHRARLR
ncbi:hypothetical protein PUR28_38050 [Streptomyces sp. BE308]|uniref:phosphoketolase family protein n=1 Tax=Streptomyces sp. BE308 TaxID=3002529 RepID=UPI002E78C03E|nr:hypothetical protein [Streptomyces sp. BE308]MEE1796523.1 hypothetical protein [Streptomyces sp. BE308]